MSRTVPTDNDKLVAAMLTQAWATRSPKSASDVLEAYDSVSEAYEKFLNEVAN